MTTTTVLQDVAKVGSPRKRGTNLWSTFPWPLLPFFLFLALFFFLPIGAVFLNSFKNNDGAFTFENIQALFQDPYRMAFLNSIKLGFYSALTASIPGVLLALAIEKKGGKNLKKFIASVSGVLANTGGVPLAFMFLAAFGPSGLATNLFKSLGLDLYSLGFTLFSFNGLLIVYSYFQIPIMIIVFTPALTALRREWRDASSNLGSTPLGYWRHVGLPILAPSFIASFLLLFASAFSAFGTARAMTVGNIALVPLQIGSLLDGNVTIDKANLGYALALGMIVISLLAMIPYILLQKRASRWQVR
jgi:putative spermidine/putrescine transport system permease protein